MKIVTFNVNGLRSFVSYISSPPPPPPSSSSSSSSTTIATKQSFPFYSFITETLQADILCIQETKIISQDKLDFPLFSPAQTSDISSFFSYPRIRKKIGYSGTATFCLSSKAVVKSWTTKLTQNEETGETWPEIANLEYDSALLDEIDGEGRIVITDHEDFILINAYFPNDAQAERLKYKMAFCHVLQRRIETLVAEGRCVILVGDLNAAYMTVDHCDFASAQHRVDHEKNGALGISRQVLLDHLATFWNHPPRVWLREFLMTGKFVDCFRYFHPDDQSAFTCWNTKLGSRISNYGSRIDYIICNEKLKSKVKDCKLLTHIQGSDHCPVSADLDIEHSPQLLSCALKNEKMRQSSISSFFKKRTDKDLDQEKNSCASSNTTSKKKKAPLITDFFASKSKAEQKNAIDSTISIAEAPMEEFDIVKWLEAEDNGEMKSEWKSIFSPKCSPMCSGHNEPSKLFKVSKKGPNQGRTFYSCSKPIGPSSDPNSKCSFFQWKT